MKTLKFAFGRRPQGNWKFGWGRSSSLGKNYFHTKNQTPRLPVSGLKQGGQRKEEGRRTMILKLL